MVGLQGSWHCLPAPPACDGLPLRATLAVRGAGCLMETHAFHRAARTGREDPQPDTNPSQQCLVVQCACLSVEQRKRKEAESKKAALEGVWGVNPKP